MNTIGERIKLRRKELGISADELAEKLNVSRSTIFRYENGGIEKVPVEYIGTIAKALYTTPSYLMGWEDNLECDTDFVAEMFKDQEVVLNVKKLIDLRKENRKIVYEMIDFLSKKEKGL